jgi:hypothetical protein
MGIAPKVVADWGLEALLGSVRASPVDGRASGPTSGRCTYPGSGLRRRGRSVGVHLRRGCRQGSSQSRSGRSSRNECSGRGDLDQRDRSDRAVPHRDVRSRPSPRAARDRLGGSRRTATAACRPCDLAATAEAIQHQVRPHRRPRLKKMLVDQVSAATGGPPAYPGRDMKETHVVASAHLDGFDPVLGSARCTTSRASSPD